MYDLTFIISTGPPAHLILNHGIYFWFVEEETVWSTKTFYPMDMFAQLDN